MKNLILLLFLFLFIGKASTQSQEPCVLLQKNGFKVEAIECYMNTIPKGGNANKAYYNIATIYFNNEDYEFAIKMANKAIEADSTMSNGFSIKGYSLMRLGYNEDGAFELIHAISLNPEDQGAHIALVEGMAAYWEFENAETQLIYCNKAIKLDSKNPFLMKRRGLLRLSQGNKVGGCLDIQTAISLGVVDLESLFKKICKS